MGEHEGSSLGLTASSTHTRSVRMVDIHSDTRKRRDHRQQMLGAVWLFTRVGTHPAVLQWAVRSIKSLHCHIIITT